MKNLVPPGAIFNVITIMAIDFRACFYGTSGFHCNDPPESGMQEVHKFGVGSEGMVDLVGKSSRVVVHLLTFNRNVQNLLLFLI